MALSGEAKSRQCRAAAYRMHSMHDSRQVTRKAREAFLARFEREVDPEGRLPLAERIRRAELAKRAYFMGLAAKSAKARAS